MVRRLTGRSEVATTFGGHFFASGKAAPPSAAAAVFAIVPD
jgi:hypothetical protein